jgi:hypothetical protein
MPLGLCILVSITARTSVNTFSETSENSVNAKFGGHGLAPVLLVSVGSLSLLHAQLESEAGEGLLCAVLAEPRPPFLGDPASSFHPRFALRGSFEGVSIFHDLNVAQAA